MARKYGEEWCPIGDTRPQQLIRGLLVDESERRRRAFALRDEQHVAWLDAPVYRHR